jgi:hypothetical protein
LKVAISEKAKQSIKSGARFEIDHDAYRHSADLPREVIESILEDFS